MAITQQRMISLIQAARDFEQAARATRAKVVKEYRLYEAKTISPEQALQNIFFLTNFSSLLEHETQSTLTIAQEDYHFRKFAKRNQAEQRRLARKRGEDVPLREAQLTKGLDADTKLLIAKLVQEDELAASIPQARPNNQPQQPALPTKVTKPKPEVRFDPDTEAQIAGKETFDYDSNPF